MSCETGLPETDPAMLRPSFNRRIPDAAGNADAFLREAAMEFFRRSGVWRTQTMRLICDTSRTTYTLPVPTAGQIVRLAHVWESTSGEERKMRHDTQIRQSDDGIQKWHQPTSKTISFHQQFEADTTLRLEAVLTVDENNVGDVDMVQTHREAIIAGASYYATMSQQTKTSNRNAGIDFYQLFEDAIVAATSKYQQKFAVEREPMTRFKAISSQR